MTSRSLFVLPSLLASVGLVAAVAGAGCHAEVGDDAASSDNALNGPCGSDGDARVTQDASDAVVAVVDPFDPASCAGSGIDEPTARAQWGIGDTGRTLGRYTLSRRIRSRGYDHQWQAWTVSAPLGATPVAGTVNLVLTPRHEFFVTLLDDADGRSGIAGGGSYGYAGALIGSYFVEGPVVNGRKTSTWLGHVIGDRRQALFRGHITSRCIRLVAHYETANAEEEIVAFGTLVPTTADVFEKPAQCYQGALSGLSAAGCGGPVGATTTTCCLAGTSMCAAHGCSCTTACN